jgi:hypothetical protein
MGDAAEAPPLPSPSSSSAVVMSDDDAERGTALKAPTAALPHHRAALSWEGLSVSVKVRQRRAGSSGRASCHDRRTEKPATEKSATEKPCQRRPFPRRAPPSSSARRGAGPQPRQPPAPPHTQDAKGATRNILKDAVGLVPPQTFCAVMVRSRAPPPRVRSVGPACA